MSVYITYFVHGTTTDNEKDIATGQNPGELSELGIRQAKELGKLVANQNFDAVFCSDLKRAVDSAKLGFENKYSIIEDSRLRECNYGDVNGSPTKNLKGSEEDYIAKAFPNGESYRDVEKRMSSFLDYVKEKYNGRHIAIVAHRFPQLALEVLLKGKTWEQALKEDWRAAKAWKPGWEYALQ